MLVLVLVLVSVVAGAPRIVPVTFSSSAPSSGGGGGWSVKSGEVSAPGVSQSVTPITERTSLVWVTTS